MFLTIHTTVAVIIGQQVSNPLLAFLIGVLSHFTLDAIPHGDEKLFKSSIEHRKLKVFILTGLVDFFISVIWLAYLFSQGHFGYIQATLAAAIGAVLPDFLNVFYLITNFKWLAWINDLNGEFVHRLIIKKPLPIAVGLAIQAILLLTCIYYLFT